MLAVAHALRNASDLYQGKNQNSSEELSEFSGQKTKHL